MQRWLRIKSIRRWKLWWGESWMGRESLIPPTLFTPDILPVAAPSTPSSIRSTCHPSLKSLQKGDLLTFALNVFSEGAELWIRCQGISRLNWEAIPGGE
jgi:hypothetical protein